MKKDFMLAGKAEFTFELNPDFAKTKDLENHYTFTVTKHTTTEETPKELYFVRLRVSNDHKKGVYFGMLNAEEGKIYMTKASVYAQDALLVRLVNRAFQRLWENNLDKMDNAGFHFHHVGKCGRCGRKLTTPKSIETGLGPECEKMVG